MAASTSTAAHSNNNSCYDVFISHRGPDVKKTFASHMYHRLIAYGLRVFLDYQELQEGAEFPCQIKGAIRTASVQIAIFSPTYADSQWCLDELVLMLETRAHIFPVFYHVKPTELRRTQGEGVYATSLRNLEKKRKYGSEPRYDSKTIENWRNALSRVADISGFDLDEGFNGDEGKLLDQLVKAVLEKGIRRLNVARYPTGLKEKVEDFETKLSLQGFVGITGLGGVGKTTLAKELFNKKSSTYSKSCFLSDVRERAKSSIPSLQRKLLKDFGASEEAIDSTDEGLEILRKHFSVLSDPVLLVLDDVDHHEQVQALLPVADKDIFPLPPSSLILITTRDNKVLIRSGVQEPSIYKLTGLNTERSRELFCSHAFSQPHPMQGFEYLVNEFLEACKGLPLSLKVIGGLLYGNTDKSYWEDELEQLRKALPHDIQKVLQISYDALPREEQEIFLDIACFFIGESRDTAIRVWTASGWNGSRGFEILLSKCLVELDISVENPFDMYRIRMHDHLRDMGRYLANNTPGFPRRLWRGTKHIKDLLQQSSEATKVRGIRMLHWEHYYDERADSDVEHADSDSDVERADSDELASFSRYKMKNLQLLDIDMEEDHLKCVLDGMDSPNLLWLRWRHCPCSSLPPYIPREKLRVLELEGDELETLWQEESQTPFRLRELRIKVYVLHKIPKSIGQLKHLELMVLKISADDTVEIPKEFWDLCSLKHFVLRIRQLRSLSDSFGDLSRLQHIDLSYCGALERLPDSFGNLSKLEHINLTGCRALERLPDSFGDLSSLQHIDLSYCRALERLPDSFGNLSKLEHINLTSCRALERLPDSFGALSSLQHIDLSYCSALERLPDSFGNLSKLEHINLRSCGALERLPDSFGNLIKLKYINLLECDKLTIPGGTFRKITVEYMRFPRWRIEVLPPQIAHQWSLEKLLLCLINMEEWPSATGESSHLEKLILETPFLEALPPCFGRDLRNLKHLELLSCWSLKRLPDSFLLLDQLMNMEELPRAIGESSHLEKLVLETPSLEALPPCFGRDLRNLKYLELRSCQSLKRLPDSFLLMDQLTKLIVKDCPLQQLHFETVEGGSETMTHSGGQGTLSNLKRSLLRLHHLELHKTQISEISFPTGVCNNLQYLDIRDCQDLVEVGTLPNALMILQLINCPKLRKIERLSGFAKLKTLGVSRCKEVEELPSIKDESVALAESTGPRELNKSDFSFDNCLLHLQHLELHNTAISEVLYPTGVCPNLQYLDIKDSRDLVEVGTLPNALIKLQLIDCPKLRKIERLSGFALRKLQLTGCPELGKLDLWNCSKLRKIEELSGLAKLQVLSIAWCEGVEELSSIETLGSLENLQVVRCSKLKSVRVLAKLTKLRELDVSNCSELEDLPGVEHLRSLEKLRACGCKKLKSIRGSAQLTQLRELDVSECSELEELLDIEHLRSLDKLRACNCARLKHLQGLAQLTQLRELDVSGCSRLEEMPGVGYLQSLVWLRASECVKLQSIQGLEQMAQLRELEVSYCFELKELLGVEHLKSLLKLQARSCRKLKNIQGLAQLTQLRELDVSFCYELKEMPGVGYLQSLVVLRGFECVKLKSLWGLPRLTHLLELDVSGCRELEEMQGVGYLSSLMVLRACECVKLKSIQGLEQLTQLLKLDVSGCSELQDLRGVGHLISLNMLRTSGCVKLKSLQVLEQMTQLLELHVCNCFELEELLGIEHLKSLKELLATNCKKLKSIQGLEQVTQLKYLDVSGCYELEKMPDVGCLESLVVLRASECVKLKSIQGLEQMTQLRELDVSYCFELEELPGFERLKSLMKLQARCCQKLNRIKELAQLAQLRELDVSLCPELEERPDVECLQ